MPRTMSVLERMEPIIEAWTMSSSPLTRARIEMRSSTALPKVALRRPPSESPTRRASCSVAKPSIDASGMMASIEKMKMTVSDWCENSIAQATGMKMSKTLNHEAVMTL
jgi:hypothetical protein